MFLNSLLGVFQLRSLRNDMSIDIRIFVKGIDFGSFLFSNPRLVSLLQLRPVTSKLSHRHHLAKLLEVWEDQKRTLNPMANFSWQAGTVGLLHSHHQS